MKVENRLKLASDEKKCIFFNIALLKLIIIYFHLNLYVNII